MESRRFRDTHYLVYPDGRVWSEYSKGKFKVFKDNGLGYLYANISFGKWGNRVKKKLYQHRMVAECWVPNPNGYTDVNHKNGIKKDNRVENLEWVTEKQNTAHAMENGWMAKGIECSWSKFKNESDIRIVRMMFLFKFPQRQIARKFGVSPATIKDIVSGNTYKGLGLIDENNL